MPSERAFEVLKEEYEVGPQSFHHGVRLERVWDRQRFDILVGAMADVCGALEGAPSLDRWLVELFYVLTVIVPDETRHPAFPRPEQEYHDAAIKMLDDLATWFATGESLYESGHRWSLLDTSDD